MSAWRAAGIAVAILLGLEACAPATEAPSRVSPSEGPMSAPPAVGSAEARLVRIVDGDTIRVVVGGREERVRLIGIDTPERDECFFREATEHLRSLILGRPLRMARDVSERDPYGRLLRYLWADGRFVNAVMVADGYANAATYPPDVAHAAEFVVLQRAARTAERGLWAPGACA
ncbi:MAG: thermonuclease family protein [Acidobacteria bacterium]|nr:thermonuclease family protein [Acidobacteriota bacterium]